MAALLACATDSLRESLDNKVRDDRETVLEKISLDEGNKTQGPQHTQLKRRINLFFKKRMLMGLLVKEGAASSGKGGHQVSGAITQESSLF